MKKFIYVLLLALTTSIAVTSCTEESITPKTEGGGANGSSDRGF